MFWDIIRPSLLRKTLLKVPVLEITVLQDSNLDQKITKKMFSNLPKITKKAGQGQFKVSEKPGDDLIESSESGPALPILTRMRIAIVVLQTDFFKKI